MLRSVTSFSLVVVNHYQPLTYLKLAVAHPRSFGCNVIMVALPPEVVGTVVHDGVVVVVEVSRGLVVILKVEVAVLAPPHVLVDDLDVLVAVAARVLVVEAERVHDLVHGAPRRAEARAVPRARPLQRQLLPLVLAPDVGPATGKWI